MCAVRGAPRNESAENAVRAHEGERENEGEPCEIGDERVYTREESFFLLGLPSQNREGGGEHRQERERENKKKSSQDERKRSRVECARGNGPAS